MSEERGKERKEDVTKRGGTQEHFLKMRLYKVITIIERRTK